VSGNESLSPLGRIKAMKTIFQGEEVTPEVKESVYSCVRCRSCVAVCPQEIDIPELIAESRAELARRGLGPLERHLRVVEGIKKLGNAVNGDPEKRWEWLPEEFPKKESDTLYYAGCMPCYRLQDAAISTYLLLKKLGVDFTMIEDEDCCGIYFYEAGMFDLARERFEQNVEKFRKLGIKKIIVSCAGCYRCFKRYYPEILGKVDFEVFHIVEILAELFKERELKQQGLEATFYDSCRLGRMEGIYEQPRYVLSKCGVKLVEMEENKENAPCCGAGAAVRSVYRDLSLKMAQEAVSKAKANTIVACCPFCVFNLRAAAKKEGKSVVHIAKVAWDSLSE
jgi:Fe-S oxidoreductase